MKIRDLTTVEEVVEAIGRDRLRDITDRESPHVSNWLAAGFFPPTLYEIMRLELIRIDARAPSSLWRQEQPPKELRALAA